VSVALEFTPASLDDAAFYADVHSAVHPTEPLDPLMLRHEWEHGYDRWTTDRSVVSQGGRRIGVALMQHAHWGLFPTRWADVMGEVLPEHRDASTLAAMFAEMERRASAEGATLVHMRTNEDDAVRVAALTARGFREDRRGKKWELDLVANHDRLLAMTEESRDRMRREGITVTTLAADADPERYRKSWRMSEEAGNDVPSSLGYIEETFEDFMRWLRTPGMYEDRVWTARAGDDVVGLSVLEYPPVRGVVGTAWTATARSVRGRGVARALKCETIAQAIALGVDRVRTGNDAKNEPILHINETMGYRLFKTRISFHKDL
jgi:GNAT superfamily N-acetyltransferase